MDAALLQDLSRQALLALLLVIPAWKICAKAGFAPATALLIFIPYVGYLALSLRLALAAWPATAAARVSKDGR